MLVPSILRKFSARVRRGSSVEAFGIGSVATGAAPLRLTLALLLGACTNAHTSPAQRAAAQDVAPSVPTPSVAAPQPLALPAEPLSSDASAKAPGELVQLEVPGFLPSLLFVPAGNAPRPLLVAAHGAGGAPEWDCDYWRRLVTDHAFVLCLRGTAMGQGAYYFKQHHALAAELDAATNAARARFPRIAKSSGIYAGFSQGASMGSLVIAERAEQFSFVVLTEGFVTWNVALGQKLAKHGGRAVLWACGTRDCASKAEASARSVERGGVRVRVEHAVGAGHTPEGAVRSAVQKSLAWLVGDDAAWVGVFSPK